MGALAAGVGLLAKFVIIPSIAVQAQNSMGVGWNDSKSELVQKFTEALAPEFVPLGLTPSELSAITNCCADQAIAFLNTTDCSYQYNQATTSEAQHLKEQEECMQRVSYEQQEAKIALSCFKEHLPNDWKLLKKGLVESFVETAVDGGMSPLDAQKAGTCFAERAVQIANERKCPLINKDAVEPSDLFNDMSNCIPTEEAEKLGVECAGEKP